MTRLQWIVVCSSVLLFALLFFGFDTTSSKQGEIEQSRSLSMESTDISILIREARSELDGTQLNSVRILEQELELADSDSINISTYKELSGVWYRLNYPALAGYYAEQAAIIEEDEQAWSIAGTTYAICTQRAEEEKIRQFCSKRAFDAFENAISLNPDNIQHKVNLALVHLESENPMMGIQMLRNLNEQYPESVLVLMTLGRQAVRTNQLERASERFLRVLEIDNDNKDAACALVEVYKKLQNESGLQQFLPICEK